MLERAIFVEIWDKIDSEEILLLNGARQVGKTSIMKMIKEKLMLEKKVEDKSIHWFDLEKVEDLAIWERQETALAFLPVKDKSRQYIFIDEFQKAKNIGSTLKVLHDHYPQFKIIVTGSASWYLTIDESMAGRKRVFSIFPLSFFEYLLWQKNNNIIDFFRMANSDIKKVSSEMINLINDTYVKFIIYGGYPAVAKEDNEKEKINILSEIMNSYLLRDIQIYNYAANSLQVKQVLTLIADNVSSLLDVNNLSKNSGLGRSALINRLELLQKTFILYLAKPYFTNKIKELVKNPKIYLIDSGIRNILLADFSVFPKTKEFGKISENFVFSELLKANNENTLESVYYWRTKSGHEVDVVLKREGELIPIEVKSGSEDSVPLNLKFFIDMYNPNKAYILNWSIVKDMKYKDTKIMFRPLWFKI